MLIFREAGGMEVLASRCSVDVLDLADVDDHNANDDDDAGLNL